MFEKIPTLSPYYEVRELLIEFGFVGYLIGQTIKQEGTNIVVCETDFFAEEETQPVVLRRPKSHLPDWYLMREGTRYSIATYRKDRPGNARYKRLLRQLFTEKLTTKLTHCTPLFSQFHLHRKQKRSGLGRWPERLCQQHNY